MVKSNLNLPYTVNKILLWEGRGDIFGVCSFFSLLTFCGGAGHLDSTGYVSRRPVRAKMVASLLSSDQITWHILKMILQTIANIHDFDFVEKR